MTKIINLWSSPRNISTALMYSFAQRSDTQVYDEPLYAHYLRVSGAEHPGREEILADMEQNGDKVMQDFFQYEGEKPVLFLKQMTHHLVELKLDFLNQTTNLFLIRDPKAMLISYSKVLPNPKMEDIGIQQQYELYQSLQKQGQNCVVVDSKEILQNPAGILEKVCEAIDIPFEKNMLQWPAGPIKEDGIWAKHWYTNVHQSTSFMPYKERHENLPIHLAPLWKDCQEFYDYMYDLSQK